MSTTQLIVACFAVLLAGLALPVPYGVRMALFLALTVLSVLTFLGGGMHYFLSMF